ncbi:MAG: hydroxymethylglutaryl-CoA lyase [Oscillospiraceae bacterium]
MTEYPSSLELVEVGPRDGFQSVKEFIPTDLKKKIIDMLVDSGCKTIEVTSFVSPKAIPQMQDATEVAKYAIETYPDVHFEALVPNLRGAQNAFDAGIRKVTSVISVSQSHNKANINRTVEESFEQLKSILDTLPGLEVVLDAATAFGCPFEGTISYAQLESYVEKAASIGIKNIDLCDTIGIANPLQIEKTICGLKAKFSQIKFGVHIHDTRNMGIANNLVALQCGITRIASAVGGMGGCPFAPGASGNTSSEDFVYMANQMSINTGINFEGLLATAKFIKENVPANYSGHHINIAPRQCTNG